MELCCSAALRLPSFPLASSLANTEPFSAVDAVGQCFKLAKEYGQMMEVYVLAGAAHTEATDLYHAGKAYENAGEAAREMKTPKKSIELLKAAAQL